MISMVFKILTKDLVDLMAQVDLADLVDLEDLAVSMIYLISLLVVENLVNNLKVVAKIFKLQLLLHLKKLASAVRKI